METQKINHSPREAGVILDVGQTTLYKLISEGRLLPVKIGRSTKIPHTELLRLQQELLDEARNRVR